MAFLTLFKSAMLKRLNSMLNPGPYLSDVPDLIATVPGTDRLDVSPATYKKYIEIIERFKEFYRLRGHPTGDIRILSITRADWATFHDWLADRGTREVTTNGYRRRARAVWNRLKERGYPVCDISGITRELPQPAQNSKALEADHLTAVLQLAGVRDTAIILYMIQSGIRRQTVPRLTVAGTFIWPRSNGRFRIASKIPQEKTSPPRVIMADHDAALAVMLWLELREFKNSPWLFYALDTGGRLQANSINTIFRSLRERANLPAWANFHPHALRHRFAQDMLDDHDAKTVSQWLGISVETLLNVYAFRSNEDLAVARYGDHDYPRELFK